MSVKTAVLWPAPVEILPATSSQIAGAENLLTSASNTSAYLPRDASGGGSRLLSCRCDVPDFSPAAEIVEVRLRYRSQGSEAIQPSGNFRWQGVATSLYHASGVIRAPGSTASVEYELRLNGLGAELYPVASGVPQWTSTAPWGEVGRPAGDPDTITNPENWLAGMVLQMPLPVSGYSFGWLRLFWVRIEIDYLDRRVVPVKDGGLWKEALPFGKDGGLWKEGQYLAKDGGLWKETV